MTSFGARRASGIVCALLKALQALPMRRLDIPQSALARPFRLFRNRLLRSACADF
jgi:hypothetical protein